MTLKIGLVSLGCPKNLVDSEIMLGLLKESGFIITNREREADILIINTCSFINDAKEESIKTILELSQLKKEGNCRALLVAGCLAQRYHRELMDEMPEIDGLIGTGDINNVPALASRALEGKKANLVGRPGYLYTASQPRVQATPFYSSYSKIAEGCDNRCSYCTIPLVRGPFRSRDMDDIVNEAAGMVKHGTKELILVAQDTTRYGMDLYGRPSLDRLLERLAGLEELVWIRLLYTYPSLISNELIHIIAREKKICSYLDIPLQHASNSILKRMKRNGNKEEIQQLITKLRSEIPGITLRSSFIVGFPGETEENFEELLSFMSAMQFDRFGVFTYSREDGTLAASMPDQVPEEIKITRQDRAMYLQQKISHKKNSSKIGTEMLVLVEKKKNGSIYTGRSEGDAPGIDGEVQFTSEVSLQPGDFVKVQILSAKPYDLTGKLV